MRATSSARGVIDESAACNEQPVGLDRAHAHVAIGLECSTHSTRLYADEMNKHLERITIDPEQCGGRACIRGLRIRVIDVLDLLASGLDQQQVLAELPDLEPQDIPAALVYARRRLDHPVLAA